MTRNIAELKSRAQLEGAQGIQITQPLQTPIPDCNFCETRKLCEQLMQTDAIVVDPGTPTCNIVNARGPKLS
jgi:hypothetical protein